MSSTQINTLTQLISELTSKIATIKSGKICLKCEGTGIVRVGEKECPICGGSGRHFMAVDDFADCNQRTAAPLPGTKNAPDSLPSLPADIASLKTSQQLAALLTHVDLLHKEVNHLLLRRVCYQCNGNGATKFNRPCKVCENQCGYVTKSNNEVLDQIYGKNRVVAAKTETNSKPCCFCAIQ